MHTACRNKIGPGKLIAGQRHRFIARSPANGGVAVQTCKPVPFSYIGLHLSACTVQLGSPRLTGLAPAKQLPAGLQPADPSGRLFPPASMEDL